jgi:hypothetical protein
MNRWRRLLLGLRQFNATQIELQERLLLLNRPWEEECLHWCWDGHGWQLHGNRLPAPPGPRGTTSEGWCPQLRHPSSRGSPR